MGMQAKLLWVEHGFQEASIFSRLVQIFLGYTLGRTADMAVRGMLGRHY